MNTHTKQFTRIGAYGLIIDADTVLLTRKKTGPFKDHWDFPGGGIEFSETPPEALHRELREEAALQAHDLQLLTVLSLHGEHPHSHRYHHISIVYRVLGFAPLPNLIPEEEGRWFPLNTLTSALITPNVRQVLIPKHLGSAGCPPYHQNPI